MKGGTETSAVIDGIMRFIMGGGAIATILVAPGMAEVLDKPTRAYFSRLDKRSQQRELRRLLYYMKQKGLIKPTAEDYAHGLVITKQGKERLKRVEFEKIAIANPTSWDQKWRLVFFDVPEEHSASRRHLISKLKQIGFQQLQQSVWIHPFPCRAEIEQVTSVCNVQKYVSYIEATGIDSEGLLINRFKSVLQGK